MAPDYVCVGLGRAGGDSDHGCIDSDPPVPIWIAVGSASIALALRDRGWDESDLSN